MAYWNTRGLRGSAFEELIDMTNQLYRQQNLAVIQKVPTPITPVAVDNKTRIITTAYFDKKSTVDFIGAAQGIPVCFDAKETHSQHLPLRNIHAHQIEFMECFREQGGVSFLLIHFQVKGEVFLLPSEEINKYHIQSQAGGRKSIPYDDFDQTYLVPNSGGFPVHYLIAINAYLQKKKPSLQSLAGYT